MNWGFYWAYYKPENSCELQPVYYSSALNHLLVLGEDKPQSTNDWEIVAEIKQMRMEDVKKNNERILPSLGGS